MARFCSSCGTEIPAGATFCPSCGTKVADVAAQAPAEAVSWAPPSNPATEAEAAKAAAAGAPADAPAPVVEAAAPATVEVPAASQAAPTTPQPAVTEVVSAPAPSGLVMAPPPGGMGGASKSSGKTMAIAGAGVAVVVAVAAFFFLKGDKGPEPGPAPANPGTEQPQDPAAPPVDPAQDPVAPEGGLADLVPQTAGSFSLVEVAPDPEFAMGMGANEAVSMTYQHADGTPLGAGLAAYSSAEAAVAALNDLSGRMQTNSGYVVAQEVTITDAEGTTQLGTAVQLTGPDEVWIWTNNTLLAFGEAPAGYATEFFDNILAGT